MNILFLVRFFSPSLGGSELVFCTIAENLAKNGHKVWVITNKIEGVEYPQHSNIKIIFVASYGIDDVKRWKQKNKMRYFFSAVKAGYSIIKNEKIDIIHSNPYEPVYAGSFLSFLTGTRHVMAIHDVTPIKKEFLEIRSRQKGNSRFNAFAGSVIFKLLFRLKHSAIHTVSETSKEDLKKYGASEPIYVVHNAVPLTNTLNVKVNPFQLVSVGRLVLNKNLKVAIKAIEKVKESFPKVTLLIVGEGPERQNLESLVSKLELKENVIFKGQVTEGQKNNLIASSQALVFPSLFEGFGMVILEAYNQSKPVLVSDVKPLSNLVENKKTGLVISQNNEEKWAQAIISILSKPDEASKMGFAGKKTLEENYSLEDMLNKVIKMYHQAVE